jgi:putative ABC transport system permease protein
MFAYALKEISKRKKKYALNMLLIALVVFMLITLNSLGTAYKEASHLPFEKIHSSIIVQRNGNVPENTEGVVTSCSLAPIQYNIIEKIKSIDGVNGVSYGLFLWVFDKDNFKRVLGVNWNDSLGAKIKANIIAGSLPQNNKEAVVDKTYAKQYKVSIGQEIVVSEESFIVSGISENSGKDVVASDIFTNLASAQNLAYNSENLQKTERFEKDGINIIFVDTEQTKVNQVSSKLNNLLNANDSGNGKTPTGKSIGSYNIYTPKSFENQISSLFSLSDKLVFLISLITIIGSVLIIVKSMSHTVMQRRKEFGIMKSIGFTSKNIQKEIMQETIIQVLTGYGLGIVLSAIAIIALAGTKISISIPWELNPYPHFLSSNPSLINTVQTYFLPIKFQPTYAIISLLIVLAIGGFAAFIITRQVNKLKAMEVLKNE